MTPDSLTRAVVLMGGIVLLVGISAKMLIREARRRDMESRVVQAVWGRAAAEAPYAGVAGYLQRLGERVRRGGRLYSSKDLEHLQGLIAAVGYNPRRVLPLLLGGKVALMVLLPACAALVASLVASSVQVRLAIVGVALIIGMMGPDLILSSLRRSYVAALEKGAPDALDLLVVCSEAGMGLESALERVSQEMRRSNRPMAMALSGLLDDLHVLPDRREALQNLGRRSGIEGLQRLTTMLAQALQFGTPLGQALRAVAAELRRDRANKLEEKAVKLPAKLVFPLIFFIMPSLYIVLLGPSFMHLYDVLGAFTTHLPVHQTHLPVHH